ncbi:MAG: RtcB family protein [Candidatus Heimdallarchaeota archaeon]
MTEESDIFKKVNGRKNLWTIEKRGNMRVPAYIYGDQAIIEELQRDYVRNWSATRQIMNVASLPGIQRGMLAMSDVHPGYGFPIGGVAAFDAEEGVVSMAGVGYDINCGVRTMLTELTLADLNPQKNELMNELFRTVPAGLGKPGKIQLEISQVDELMREGAGYMVEKGYGTEEDLEYTEENGRIDGADPERVSLKAKKRQYNQIGTLGSGNHYLELQVVSKVFDEVIAKKFGLFPEQLLITMHCGSRGLGHQIGTDYSKVLVQASQKYNLPLPDKELGSAPIKSKEGQDYIAAVNSGINCAFANRQVIAHLVRETVHKVLGTEVHQLYDVGHNTSKFETHDGKRVLVHRKGSTRAFGPEHSQVPSKYKSVGHPVLIGGTMGTSSYILTGTELGMQETFGSACHGAGRSMSRKRAKKQYYGKDIVRQLAERGIVVKAHSFVGVAEEAPGAYKDVEHVVDAMHDSGVVKKVVQVKPVGVVKG